MNEVIVKLASTDGRLIGNATFPTVPPIGSVIKILKQDSIAIAEVVNQEFLVKPLGIAGIKVIIREMSEVVNDSNLKVSIGDFIEFTLYGELYFGQVIQLPEYAHLVCIGFKHRDHLPQLIFIKSLVREGLTVINKARYYSLLFHHTIEAKDISAETEAVQLVYNSGVHDLCPILKERIRKAICCTCKYNGGIEEEEHRLGFKFKVKCNGGS